MGRECEGRKLGRTQGREEERWNKGAEMETGRTIRQAEPRSEAGAWGVVGGRERW